MFRSPTTPCPPTGEAGRLPDPLRPHRPPLDSDGLSNEREALDGRPPVLGEEVAVAAAAGLAGVAQKPVDQRLGHARRRQVTGKRMSIRVITDLEPVSPTADAPLRPAQGPGEPRGRLPRTQDAR